jgi:hypothetical protein
MVTPATPSGSELTFEPLVLRWHATVEGTAKKGGGDAMFPKKFPKSFRCLGNHDLGKILCLFNNTIKTACRGRRKAPD